MDNSYIYNLLSDMNVKRSMIFTSLSSKDKAVALRLIRKIEEMNLSHWCMYDENGKERNISGDVYTEVISRMLKKCCLFLMLISKHSLCSPEVKREIHEVTQTARTEKDSKLKIIPILIDDTNESDIPEEVVALSGITTEVIVRRLSADTSEEDLNFICDEIRSQYIATVLDNIERGFQRQKKSDILLDIMDWCIKRKCSVTSVSENIKQSREVYTDSLKELHIVSNEMLDFDCNPFCCMVVSSNLRGNETWIDKKKYYDPAENGVKYFYYYPESAVAECRSTFEKLKSYLLKDTKSRREVTNLIRKDFCQRNNILTFFSGFDGLTQNQFIENYHIVDPQDLKAFLELFSQEDTQFYFAYAEDDDIFQVPDEFIAWASGETDRFTYDNMIEISYEFITFLGKFLEVLENAKDINKVSFEDLKKNYSYLLKLQRMEEWQAGNIRLNRAESRRLINFLFDYTVGSTKKAQRKFPKLARWLEIEYDKNGNIVQLDPKIIEQSMNNLIGIPLKNTDALKLCYSFELFIEDATLTAAWYSVEQWDSTKNDSMVFSYEINQRTDVFESLISAFHYLIDIYPEVRETLEKHESRMLNL